jgi:hypothetical protein
VQIDTPANGEVLQYVSANSRWENTSISSIANGNSNVSIASSNGNVAVNVGGTTYTFSDLDLNVTTNPPASPAPSLNGFGIISAPEFTNGNGNVTINSNSNAWRFDSTGNLTLPAGGNLIFSNTQIQSSAYAGGNGHAMMIDTNRTDDYEANGSADKPFKTFMAAVEAVADLNPGGTVPYTFVLMGCNITETVDLSSYNFNFITISTTCRSTFTNPVTIGNSALKQLTVRNVEFGNTVDIIGDGTALQLNNTSFYNVTFSGALTVTAANALAFYEAAFFSTVTLNNISYLYINGAQYNDDWTIRSDDTGAYPIPTGGITPGVAIALDFIANDINFVKGGTGTFVFQPHSSRMGRSAESYALPAGWIITAYSSVFVGTWTNNGTWTMRNSSSVNAIAGTAPTYSGTIGGSTAILTTGNITTINSGLLQNGNSNITLTANGNVSIQAAGSTVELVVTSTGANVTGTFNATGNANIANIGATDGVFTGNISGNTNGFTIGYLNVPQVAAANATLALTDAGKHYYSTTAGNFTLTIPNNATTAFATGTAISIVVQAAGNILANADTGVTLYMAGNSTAANRVVGGYGMATLMKVATDTWFINGTGVS